MNSSLFLTTSKWNYIQITLRMSTLYLSVLMFENIWRHKKRNSWPTKHWGSSHSMVTYSLSIRPSAFLPSIHSSLIHSSIHSTIPHPFIRPSIYPSIRPPLLLAAWVNYSRQLNGKPDVGNSMICWRKTRQEVV